MESKLELFPVDEFCSFNEYEKLKSYLKWLVSEDVLLPIERGDLPVLLPFFEDEEKWYKDLNDNVWVLIPPDYPFKGFFKLLSEIK